MSITIPSVEDAQAQILAIWRNRFPGRSLQLESFLGKLSRAETMSFFMFLQAVVLADNDANPSSKTSSAKLDEWAETVGISNGNGSYGRKLATAAVGLQGTVTGTNATVFTDGLELVASDGETTFTLNGAVTIPGTGTGTGSITGVFDAVTTGTIGNLAAGDVLSWSSPPAGGDATVTLISGPSTDGIDIESDADVLTRILERFQSPPKGGTATDYRGWAESISGVKRGYVYPLRGGIGSVDVVITSAGSGQDRVPTSAIQTDVETYYDTVRPVTSQGFNVRLPYAPDYGTGPSNTGGLVIKCRLVPAADKFAFDWDDTGATYTVAAYSAGATTTLQFSAALPADLKAAITADSNARLQILVSTTGGPAVPVQVQCIDHDGVDTVTLENPLPDGWVAPTVGDRIYAGGPMVNTVATAILDYIDGLGPARDVYADANDPWESTAAIARITQIALDQTDGDGTRFASNIVSGGVTIANGTNAAAATDVTASTGNNQLELLYAKWIAVIQ